MTTYYTYDPSTRTLSPAPRAVRTPQGIVCNPTPAQYAAIGAYQLAADTTPTPPEGKVAILVGYELRDSAWHRVYRYEDAPPRTFSKYRLVRALQAENVWDEVKTWLQSQEGAWDLYLAAEDISEDEPLLTQGIAAVKQLLGWTDEQVAAVLDAAAIGGGT